MVQQQSCKYFSTELSPILLDVYDSFKKFGTMALLLEQEPYVLYINLS